MPIFISKGERVSGRKTFLIRNKILLIVAVAFVLTAAGNIFLIEYHKSELVQKAIDEQTMKARTLCAIISKYSVQGIIAEDTALDGSLNKLVQLIATSGSKGENGSKSDIEYVIILNNDDIALMHSNYSKVGKRIADSLTSVAGRATEFGYRQWKGGRVFDYYMPIYAVVNNGDDAQTGNEPTTKLGYIRIGLSLDLRAQINGVITNYIVISLLLMLTVLVGAAYLAKKATAPIMVFTDSISESSEYDLTKRIATGAADETLALSKSFDKYMNNFNGFVLRIIEASNEIEEANEDFTKDFKWFSDSAQSQAELVERSLELMDTINHSAKTVFNNIEHLSGFSSDNLVYINDMSKNNITASNIIDNVNMYAGGVLSAIEKMSSSISNAADDIRRLSSVSNRAYSFINKINNTFLSIKDTAKEAASLSEIVTVNTNDLGLESVRNSIDGMQRIKHTVNKATEVISRLCARSIEIGKILTVINEIAEQTNLLALNAAILASAAGEHGKGFNVVASEIRELSERTASSTSEI